jgi:hypothetical protein
MFGSALAIWEHRSLIRLSIKTSSIHFSRLVKAKYKKEDLLEDKNSFFGSELPIILLGDHRSKPLMSQQKMNI